MAPVNFRFQIYALDGEHWGYPYLDLGRCLMRVRELNIFESANRYSIKPVRTRL